MHFAITVQSRLSRGWVRVDLLLTCVLHVHVVGNVILVNNPMLEIVISVQQWRSSIGCFCPQIIGHKCVNDENLCEICGDNVNCEKCTCNDLKVMCNLLVTALIIALLLIVSRNVELNEKMSEM